jgi:hypothetical protein
MSYESEQALRKELTSGETLLWTGQPGTGIRLRPADALMIPFSLLWAGFAVFWEVSVFRTDAPFFFRLWGIPFVLVGLYIVFGRFVAGAWQRSRAVYGLTSRRVIIVGGLTSRQTRSLPLQQLGPMTLHERADRSGTITFGSVPSANAWMAGSGWPGLGRQLPLSFDMVEHARDLYTRIHEAQQATIAAAGV